VSPNDAAVTLCSVIIPAHNEASVIGRALDALVGELATEEFDVIVVSNGSGDGTAEVARATMARHNYPVTVLNLDEASKTNALRAGSRQARCDTQIFLDADVVLPGGTARTLAQGLQVPGPRVAAPRLHVDVSRSSPLVRRYYRTWTSMPYVQESLIGSGVFAINSQGLDRVGAFPDVLNDDGWVHRQFSQEERITAPGEFTVFSPRTARALISRRARVLHGNKHLDDAFGSDSGGGTMGILLDRLRHGQVSGADVAVFVGVTVASRCLAEWRRRRGRPGAWSTDHSSRVS
jgi:glycosyltransferase involved in cell wall biosynthesis